MAGEKGGGQAMQGAGYVLDVIAQYQQSSAQKLQDKFAAKQMKRNAKMLLAEAGREASTAKREGDLTQSRAKALMAAQGGGVDTSRLAEIQQATDYNMVSALYEGEQASRTERLRADLTGLESGMKTRAANMGVATKLFEGGSKFAGEWDRYKKNRDLKKAGNI